MLKKLLQTTLRGRLDDPLWRLNNLYWIEDKNGHVRRFRMNRAQRRLHSGLWNRNVVLKARQLGISTYVALLMLDRCLFTANYHAGIIDKTLPDAEQKLEKGFRIVTNCGEEGGQTVGHLHFHMLAQRNLAWPPG